MAASSEAPLIPQERLPPMHMNTMLPTSFAMALQLSSPRVPPASARPATTSSRPASPRVQPSSARAPAYLSSSLMSSKYEVRRIAGQEVCVPLTAREVERQIALAQMQPRQLKPRPPAKLAPLDAQMLAPLVLPVPPSTSPPALQRSSRRTRYADPTAEHHKPRLSARPPLADLHSNMPINPSRLAGRSKPASPLKKGLWRERSDLSVIAPGTPAPPSPAPMMRGRWRVPPPRAVPMAAAVQTSTCDVATDATPGPRLGRTLARRMQSPGLVERSPAGWEATELREGRKERRRDMRAAAAERRLSQSMER